VFFCCPDSSAAKAEDAHSKLAKARAIDFILVLDGILIFQPRPRR
jgi:hypothetical protein